MRSRRAGLACLLLLTALAGCGGGGALGPDPAKSARKRPPAYSPERPPADSAEKAGGHAEPAAADEAHAAPRGAPAETKPLSDRSPDRPAPTAGPARAAAAPVKTAAPLEATPEPEAGEEAPAAEAGEAVKATEAIAAPATEPTGDEAAVAPVVGAGEEEAPVAEPPPGSIFWFWFLTILATALVGTAAWFFLQPPWKRGRWWRLFKAYVRDWRSGRLDETPPAGSPSLGVFLEDRAAGSGKARSEPASAPLRVLKGPSEQESGPETSLHLADLSEEGSAGAAPGAKRKSTRHGDAFKPRETGGGAGSAATKSAGKGRKSGKSRKTGRKRKTNVTLPVISRHSKGRKKG